MVTGKNTYLLVLSAVDVKVLLKQRNEIYGAESYDYIDLVSQSLTDIQKVLARTKINLYLINFDF